MPSPSRSPSIIVVNAGTPFGEVAVTEGAFTALTRFNSHVRKSMPPEYARYELKSQLIATS